MFLKYPRGFFTKNIPTGKVIIKIKLEIISRKRLLRLLLDLIMELMLIINKSSEVFIELLPIIERLSSGAIL